MQQAVVKQSYPAVKSEAEYQKRKALDSQVSRPRRAWRPLSAGL